MLLPNASSPLPEDNTYQARCTHHLAYFSAETTLKPVLLRWYARSRRFIPRGGGDGPACRAAGQPVGFWSCIDVLAEGKRPLRGSRAYSPTYRPSTAGRRPTRFY